MKRVVLLFLLLGLALARGEEAADRLIILANARQPESVALARFYAAQRGVPETNIIALPLPETESITWRQFIDQVWQPLQDELSHRGRIDGMLSDLLDRFGRRRCALTSHTLSYLVLCRGVPLRIYNDPTLLPPLTPGRKINTLIYKNEAAVDSELSLLAMGSYEPTGLVANPLFAQDGRLSLEAEQIIKVMRLDGPTWESARHLVTSAIEAEHTGLLGRYYVDLKGPHAEGDVWLESVRSQLEDLGFEGDTDREAGGFSGAARFDAPVFYFGWYAGNVNGPFTREGFAFPPGAIAMHIHSSSAQTLHSNTTGWCGPLLARGVAATVGNVFEPYLQFTHRPNLLLRALSEGRNFGDAAYYALPALSWQAVAIGDPLYRPFRVSLAEQRVAVASLPPMLASYAAIREARLLDRKGQGAEALALLRADFKARPSLSSALALARLLRASDDPAGAAAALGFVAQLTTIRPADWPLVREAAALLVGSGSAPAGLTVYANLAKAPGPSPEARRELLVEARQAADAAGNLPASLAFARQLEKLTAPLPES